MASGLTCLITGANRGIGLGLTQALLLRPQTTVIASVRNKLDPSVKDLDASPHHPTSTLIVIELDSTSDADFANLPHVLESNGVLTLDIIVSNAGYSSGYGSAHDTTLAALRSDFETNTLGPIKLYRACYNLLNSSKTGTPKFVLVSSVLGSIGALGVEAGPTLAYGSSKAAANFFVRKVHFENENLVAFAIHPGWVKTAMGQGFADAVGVPTPPMELKACVDSLLKQIRSPPLDPSFHMMEDLFRGKLLNIDR